MDIEKDNISSFKDDIMVSNNRKQDKCHNICKICGDRGYSDFVLCSSCFKDIHLS